METSVSGFKVEGDWQKIVQHGEQVELVLRTLFEETECKISESDIDEFNEWRPKTKDVGREKKLKQRTAGKASISEGVGEQREKNAVSDIKQGVSEISCLISNPNDAEFKRARQILKRAIDTTTRKLFRLVEEFVYAHIMTQISPYYFDNELINANITRVSESEYSFEVNISDDTVKKKSQELLEVLAEKDRWHTEREIDDSHIAHLSESHTPSIESKSAKQLIRDEL